MNSLLETLVEDNFYLIFCRNFYSIASGQNQQGFTYRGTIFHRIIPQFMLQVVMAHTKLKCHCEPCPDSHFAGRGF